MIRNATGRRLSVWTLGVLLAGALMTQAEQAPPEAGSLLKLKAGVCSFTVLDQQGVNPLAGLNVVLASPEDGSVLLKGTTDVAGACSLDIAAGRYVLNVKGMDLAILETSADQTLAQCRIVLPESAMVAGGADAATPPTNEKSSKKGGFWLLGSSGSSMTPFVVGSVVVLAAAGGGYAIYENNNDDNNDDNDTRIAPPPAPTTTRRATEQPSSRPRPPSVSN